MDLKFEISNLRFFGFKPARFRQWLVLARSEGGRYGYVRMFGHMLWTLLTGQFVGRPEWRRRMRVCRKCPIYNRLRKQCRPHPAHPLGCGCWTPGLALAAKKCYADEFLPAERLGWNARKTV